MKKKNRFYLKGQGNWMGIYILAIMSIFFMFAISCSKQDDNTNNPPVTTVQLPVLTTSALSSVTSTTAQCGGNISSNGGATVTARGVCWGTAATPTIADNKTTDSSGIGSYTSTISGLTASTTYYVRAYATNSKGTAYGVAKTFTTLPPAIQVPLLTTSVVSAITETTASCGGTITSDGGSSVIARGVCWSIGTTPTITDSKTSNGTGTGSFTSAITGLVINNTYYVRAYATNSAGTGYGNAVSFTTELTDIDSNVYHIVTIGTQVWMVENLKTTRYNDGITIPSVTDNTEWYKLVTPAYCWYDNDAATYKSTYGAMYNWYTVNTGKLCPVGWHVPSDAEWVQVTNYLGGEGVAGSKLKEPGTAHWKSPNDCDSNNTGFKGLPGGHRDSQGEFGDIGEYGYWWSTTVFNTDNAWFRYMSYDNLALPKVAFYKYDGYSVRCLKN